MRPNAIISGRAYWLLFFTFLCLSVFGSGLVDRLDGSQPELASPPRPQSNPLRIEELLVDHGRNPLSLLSVIKGPVRIEAEPAGNLFVIDDGNKEVIAELGHNGDLLHIFEGNGVPQMKSVTDLAILPDRLWVADLLGSSIHVLDRASGTWNTSKVSPEPYRIETVGAGRERLIFMRVLSPYLFDVTTAGGEVVRPFGKLLRSQEEHALALDGFIARSAGSIIYSGEHLGVIASFSESGRLNYLRNAIDPPKEPVLMSRGGNRWLRSGPIRASLSIAGNNEGFYVLAPRVMGVQVRHFIDVYRASDGTYSKSLLLPGDQKWRSLAVGGEHLWVASDQRIIQWPITVLKRSVTIPEVSTGRSFINFSR